MKTVRELFENSDAFVKQLQRGSSDIVPKEGKANELNPYKRNLGIIDLIKKKDIL